MAQETPTPPPQPAPLGGGIWASHGWSFLPPPLWVMTSLCNFLEEVVEMIFLPVVK